MSFMWSLQAERSPGLVFCILSLAENAWQRLSPPQRHLQGQARVFGASVSISTGFTEAAGFSRLLTLSLRWAELVLWRCEVSQPLGWLWFWLQLYFQFLLKLPAG